MGCEAKKQERKGKKQSNPVTNRLCFLGISVYLSPIVRFVNELKKGDVEINERGDSVLNIFGTKVDAFNNIKAILELYCKISIECLNVDVSNDVREFERLILNPLHYGSPVFEKSLFITDKVIDGYRLALSKSNIKQVERITHELLNEIEGKTI